MYAEIRVSFQELTGLVKGKTSSYHPQPARSMVEKNVEGVSASPEIDGDWDHRVGETDESVVYPWIQFKDI